MVDPNLDRLTEVESTIRAGFRVHARSERRVQSVRLADDLATVYDRLPEADIPVEGEIEDIGAFFTDADRNLQRTRKIVEVLEDSMDIGLGHSKLADIAMTGANANSAVALITASHNLLLTSNRLDDAHQAAKSIGGIAKEHFEDFYHAIGLVVAEAILFSTPINYKIAWRGTRFLNNRFLYKLRYNSLSGKADELTDGLQRLVMSESHNVIRGILPSALRRPQEFVSYLSSMAKQTLAIIWQFRDLGVSQIRGKVEELVGEYRTFAERKYGISAVEVDIDAVVEDVVADLPSNVDLLNARGGSQAFDGESGYHRTHR